MEPVPFLKISCTGNAESVNYGHVHLIKGFRKLLDYVLTNPDYLV